MAFTFKKTLENVEVGHSNSNWELMADWQIAL